MIKKIIIIMLLFLSLNSWGSKWEFGFKLGITKNYFSIDYYKKYEFKRDRYEYQLSMMLRKDICKNFFIQMESLYNRRGFGFSDGYGGKRDVILYYWENPILFGIKIYNFQFIGGFYWGKYLSSYEYYVDKDGETKEYWDYFNGIMEEGVYGTILGISYRLDYVIFEIRYSLQTSEILQKWVSYTDTRYMDRAEYLHQWVFSLGFFF